MKLQCLFHDKSELFNGNFTVLTLQLQPQQQCYIRLIGLIKGKLPTDDTLLGEFIKPKQDSAPIVFTLMGTPDDKLFVDPADRDDLPEVFDDFNLDYEVESKRWHRSRRNARKVKCERGWEGLVGSFTQLVSSLYNKHFSLTCRHVININYMHNIPFFSLQRNFFNFF
jgi:hypothetical protein